MTEPIFFDGFDGVIRILLISPVAYVSLIVFLRIAGKRTLSKLNAFDFVVTVALGSALSTQILSSDVPLVDGVAAFASLIGLQWLVSFTSIHFRTVRNLTRSEPALLASDGELHRKAMRRERVTEGEMLQAVRSEGGENFKCTKAIYMQTDGSLAVIMRPPCDPP